MNKLYRVSCNCFFCTDDRRSDNFLIINSNGSRRYHCRSLRTHSAYGMCGGIQRNTPIFIRTRSSQSAFVSFALRGMLNTIQIPEAGSLSRERSQREQGDLHLRYMPNKLNERKYFSAIVFLYSRAFEEIRVIFA